jgi:hypothetical protein
MSVSAKAMNELNVVCVSVFQAFVGEDFVEINSDKRLL